MNRRDFVKITATGLAAGAGAAAPAKNRPNIIVILADDMGFSDLGCYGGEIATPNIDRLASSGVRFTHFRNTARCCPSRTSLLTGLYAHQAGVGHMVNPRPNLPGYAGDLNNKCVTVAQVLQKAGYQTMMAGKWHVTPPNKGKDNWPLQRGFDKYYGIIGGAASYYQPMTLTRDNTPIEAEGKDYYLTDAIGKNSCQYIEAAAKSDKPFFLYTAFTAPHWPLHAFESDIAKYKGKYAGGWDQLREERHKRQIKMGIVDAKWGITPRDEDIPAWKDAQDKEWYQRRMEVYAAQIDRMDQNIGRMLETLKKSGKEENTLIMILADNGGCAEEQTIGKRYANAPAKTVDGRDVKFGNMHDVMPGPDDTFASYGIAWANASNTPFRRYKHWVHEGGIASPLIAHWPKGIQKPGTITHENGHVIDIMATCVDLAGATYPGTPILPFEGKSLVPAFNGKKIQRTDAIYWEHEGNRAVIDGKYKVVSRYPDKWEMYDLEADRCEMHDISASDPKRFASMTARYDAWAKRCTVEPWEKISKIKAAETTAD